MDPRWSWGKKWAHLVLCSTFGLCGTRSIAHLKGHHDQTLPLGVLSSPLCWPCCQLPLYRVVQCIDRIRLDVREVEGPYQPYVASLQERLERRCYTDNMHL